MTNRREYCEMGHKGGRKRKPGKREPNGKLSRLNSERQARRTMDEQDAMAVTKAARLRLYSRRGVTLDNAGTDLAGSVAGRLYLAGQLEPEQLNAARLLVDTYAAFQRAVDSPRPPKAVALGEATGPSGADVTPEQGDRARSHWRTMERLLGKVNEVYRGSTIYAACYYVVLQDIDLPHLFSDMRLGLDAIVTAYSLRSAA